MGLPFKPKGSAAGPETTAMDSMVGEEKGETVDDMEAPMSLAEAGALALRAQKIGDGEAFGEAVLKIVAAGKPSV